MLKLLKWNKQEERKEKVNKCTYSKYSWEGIFPCVGTTHKVHFVNLMWKSLGGKEWKPFPHYKACKSLLWVSNVAFVPKLTSLGCVGYCWKINPQCNDSAWTLEASQAYTFWHLPDVLLSSFSLALRSVQHSFHICDCLLLLSCTYNRHLGWYIYQGLDSEASCSSGSCRLVVEVQLFASILFHFSLILVLPCLVQFCRMLLSYLCWLLVSTHYVEESSWQFWEIQQLN